MIHIQIPVCSLCVRQLLLVETTFRSNFWSTKSPFEVDWPIIWNFVCLVNFFISLLFSFLLRFCLEVGSLLLHYVMLYLYQTHLYFVKGEYILDFQLYFMKDIDADLLRFRGYGQFLSGKHNSLILPISEPLTTYSMILSLRVQPFFLLQSGYSRRVYICPPSQYLNFQIWYGLEICTRVTPCEILTIDDIITGSRDLYVLHKPQTKFDDVIKN